MRKLSLDLPTTVMPVFTLLNYGDTRTGKTHFAATWPRPLILADVAESGWRTIPTMDRSTWFEPDVEPDVRGIENMNDISVLKPELEQLIAVGRVKTVVFDAFSFYTDFFLSKLFALQGSSPDNRRAYGDLGKHLREIRMILGQLGVNVIYNCLAKHPEQEDPKGRPMIPGQQADKFSAGVDFLWHSRVQTVIAQGKVVDEIRERRTRQFGAYIAGHRLGTRAELLPDPFVGNYCDLVEALGYDVEAIRKSFPKYGTAPVVPVQTKPVTPPAARPAPTVITRPATKVGTPVVTTNPASRGATTNNK